MFIPKRILFEKDAFNFDMGNHIYNYFKDNKNVEIIEMRGNKIKENIPGNDIYTQYREGKNTLVIGVKKGFKFQTCKPSANYQLPLISGCIGQCQYCYLNTNLGDKPYIKINVNINDILDNADKYIMNRLPEVTVFEGAATSDPIPVEPYTNALKQTIEYFGQKENGKFRFVTKYTDINSLLNINHKNKTEIRFTLNTDKVINEYENRTPSSTNRIEACCKIIDSGYPLGFIIAPVILYENWKEDYRNLLLNLKSSLPAIIDHSLTFEIISHRYTTRAKNLIQEVYPDSKLPMNDNERTYKYGQFGYGKFTYQKHLLKEMKDFFIEQIDIIFKNYIIKYII